jgi:hypothetical protein
MWTTYSAYNSSGPVHYVSIRADPDTSARGVTTEQGVFTGLYKVVECIASSPGEPISGSFPKRGCMGSSPDSSSYCLSTFWVPDTIGGGQVLAMFRGAPDSNHPGDPCHELAGSKMLDWAYSQPLRPTFVAESPAGFACPPGVNPKPFGMWEMAITGALLRSALFVEGARWLCFAALAVSGAFCIMGTCAFCCKKMPKDRGSFRSPSSTDGAATNPMHKGIA